MKMQAHNLKLQPGLLTGLHAWAAKPETHKAKPKPNQTNQHQTTTRPKPTNTQSTNQIATRPHQPQTHSQHQPPNQTDQHNTNTKQARPSPNTKPTPNQTNKQHKPNQHIHQTQPQQQHNQVLNATPPPTNTPTLKAPPFKLLQALLAPIFTESSIAKGSPSAPSCNS